MIVMRHGLHTSYAVGKHFPSAIAYHIGSVFLNVLLHPLCYTMYMYCVFLFSFCVLIIMLMCFVNFQKFPLFLDCVQNTDVMTEQAYITVSRV